MRFTPSTLFTIVVVGVAAYAVFTSKEWPLGAGLFPWFVGIPVLVLSLVQLIMDGYASMKPRDNSATDTGDLQVDWSMSTAEVAKRALTFGAWLLALFFGIILFGFFLTIPLFTLFYLKFQAKESWTMSVSLTVGVLIFFVGLFDQILHVHWPVPVIEAPEQALRDLMPWLG